MKSSIQKAVTKLGENKKAVLIVTIMFLVYFLWHFGFIYYKDQRMLTFCFEPLGTLHTAKGQSGWIIGSYTLETELGPVTIKPFCSFSSSEYQLGSIPYKNIVRKRAQYDFIVMENKITSDGGLLFSIKGDLQIKQDISGIFFKEDPQILEICGYTFKTAEIRIERFKDIKRLGELRIILAKGQQDVTLASGEKLQFLDKDEYVCLSKLSNDNWEIRVYGDSVRQNYIMITKPDGKAQEKYISVIFKENFGDFIEGELFVGREENGREVWIRSLIQDMTP